MKAVLSSLLADYVDINGKNKLLHEQDRVLTHLELEMHSNQFARYLLKKGISKNNRIVVMLELNIDTIIAIMGIIKTGAIYVPIDKTQTEHMVDEIVKDVSPCLVICSKQYLKKFRNTNVEKYILYAKDSEFFDYLLEDKKSISKELISKDIVYISYTSGTTGRPKGVMISHESVMTFLRGVTQNTYYHNKQARSLCRTPISFDPFLTEILPSVISGGQVYIQERDVSFRKFIDFVATNKITNFGCGPSMLYLMSDNLNFLSRYDLTSLKEIYIGYEKCSTSVIKILQYQFPNITFINGYGTTETFASSTFYEIPNLKDEVRIPIGNAIMNEQLLVLNDEKNLCADNEIGELVIRGTSLFNGYWNNKAATDQKLIVNPLFPESNEMVFLTGDLVVRDKNGDVFFIGRKDNQIKINGYRVELEEIQHVVESMEQIKECYVMYYQNTLVCFYNTYRSMEEEAIQKNCREKLPLYKMPKEWIEVKEFPRNSNGKIEKEKLVKQWKRL